MLTPPNDCSDVVFVSLFCQDEASLLFSLTHDPWPTNRLTYWYGLSGQPQIWFSFYLKNEQQSMKSHSHMGFHGAPYRDHCFLPYTLQIPALQSPVSIQTTIFDNQILHVPIS